MYFDLPWLSEESRITLCKTILEEVAMHRVSLIPDSGLPTPEALQAMIDAGFFKWVVCVCVCVCVCFCVCV